MKRLFLPYVIPSFCWWKNNFYFFLFFWIFIVNCYLLHVVRVSFKVFPFVLLSNFKDLAVFFTCVFKVEVFFVELIINHFLDVRKTSWLVNVYFFLSVRITAEHDVFFRGNFLEFPFKFNLWMWAIAHIFPTFLIISFQVHVLSILFVFEGYVELSCCFFTVFVKIWQLCWRAESNFVFLFIMH